MAKRNILNWRPGTGKQEPQEQQPDFKRTGYELTYKKFKHNQHDELCRWVNENKTDVLTIAADGNRITVFYWQPVTLSEVEGQNL